LGANADDDPVPVNRGLALHCGTCAEHNGSGAVCPNHAIYHIAFGDAVHTAKRYLRAANPHSNHRSSFTERFGERGDHPKNAEPPRNAAGASRTRQPSA
jgi:hypothetical protein